MTVRMTNLSSEKNPKVVNKAFAINKVVGSQEEEPGD